MNDGEFEGKRGLRGLHRHFRGITSRQVLQTAPVAILHIHVLVLLLSRHIPREGGIKREQAVKRSQASA